MKIDWNKFLERSGELMAYIGCFSFVVAISNAPLSVVLSLFGIIFIYGLFGSVKRND